MMPLLVFEKVKLWITNVVESSGYEVGELHYYFCSDEALLKINRDRLGHDFYTDIVTFPMTDCSHYICSEFCLSLDRIAENSLTFGRPFESELLRVVIHGVLHLIGFDDLTDEQEAAMRKKEEDCLNIFYKKL